MQFDFSLSLHRHPEGSAQAKCELLAQTKEPQLRTEHTMGLFMIVYVTLWIYIRVYIYINSHPPVILNTLHANGGFIFPTKRWFLPGVQLGGACG